MRQYDRETEIQGDGRKRDRRQAGRQAWRHEIVRQGDSETGERETGERETGDRRQAGGWETGMET